MEIVLITNWDCDIHEQYTEVLHIKKKQCKLRLKAGKQILLILYYIIL